MDNNSAQQIIERADKLYGAREDIKNVRTSVELLRGALNEVVSYEIAWRISRALFFLGQEEPGAATKRELHAQGVDAGNRAVRAGAELVEGHFWLGVNLALLARAEHAFKAAAYALQAKRALKRAVIIDPSYHAAGPLRALARLQHKLPRLLGGGVVPAQENYEQAIALAPQNTVTGIYFADLLLETGETARARAALEAVLSVQYDPAWAFEIARDRRLAKEMIKKL